MGNKLNRISAILIYLLAIFSPVFARVQSPSDYLGVEIGADYQLVDYHQIIEYLTYLDEQSGRLQLQDLGATTMGNRFILAIISSEENLRHLDRYLEIQAKLADPRKINDNQAEHLIQEGKTVVLINCAIHATEIGSTQWAPLFIYYLVTSEEAEVQEILNNVILLITPSHNPDGQLLVTDWYRKTLRTPYENAPMPYLYHKYVGHDNNRDWFMFTQKETRITVEKIHNVWHPQIVHDMHQMGSNGARIFLPPYTDPFEPNVSPILIAHVNMLGETMAAALIRAGKSGVITNTIFDLWTPARAYQHYHGGVRLLTEVASARIASPIEIPFEHLGGRGGARVKEPGMHFPVPWPGGKWSLRDIIDYEWIAVMAELKHAARFRDDWLKGFYQIHKNACQFNGRIWGFLIPNNLEKQTEIMELLDILTTADVEIHRIESNCQVGNVLCKAGDYVIPLAQPYGSFARAMLEKRKYPDLVDATGKLKPPYDVVSNNLPLLLNLQIDTLFAAPETVSEDPSTFHPVLPDLSSSSGKYLVIPAASYGSDVVAIRLAQRGVKVSRIKEALTTGGVKLLPGSYIVKNSTANRKKLHLLMKEIPVSVVGINTLNSVPVMNIKSPGIGLYHSWVPSMDEGWTRWIFDHYHIQYVTLHNEEIQRLRKPGKIQIVLFADQNAHSILKGYTSKKTPPEYRGGIEEKGMKALQQFVHNGGTILAWGNATQAFIDGFSLQIKNSVEGLSVRQFFIPGSMLGVEVDEADPLTFGFQSPVPIFFRKGRVFEVKQGKVYATFLPGNPILTGWITGPEYIAEKPAAVQVPSGKGQIILLGFAPQFRAQARGTYKFLFNAIFSAAEKK